MRTHTLDAQSALGFLISQISYIEPTVYRIRYPDIQYPALIPVDTTAPEWTKSVTFFSMDIAGQADWVHANAKDIPLADVERAKFEQGISMAGIGYRYNLEELGQAMMIPGMNITADRAAAAKRASEEFIDLKALHGDTAKGWQGLLNNTSVTAVDAAANGTGGSQDWRNKTAQQILNDINELLTGVYVASQTVEYADTVLLPVALLQYLSTQMINATATMSILEWLTRYNTYTMITNQPLTIRAVRGLERAGDGFTGRMVAYRRDPQVVKLHIPMPHRFLPVWQTGPLVFDIPGIFRFGGVEIRIPGAVRYLDGIMDAVS